MVLVAIYSSCYWDSIQKWNEDGFIAIMIFTFTPSLFILIHLFRMYINVIMRIKQKSNINIVDVQWKLSRIEQEEIIGKDKDFPAEFYWKQGEAISKEINLTFKQTISSKKEKMLLFIFEYNNKFYSFDFCIENKYFYLFNFDKSKINKKIIQMIMDF